MNPKWLKKSAFFKSETIALVKGGASYFEEMLHIINSAQTTIHLQVYNFQSDQTGEKIIQALCEAAKRKVEVYVLIDAFGASGFTAQSEKILTDNHVHFRRFSPVLSFRGIQLGRRLHHKILVTDNKTALVGGINIADKYAGTKLENAWLDYAVKIEGNLCEKLQELCLLKFKRQAFVFKRRKKNKLPILEKMVRITRNDWANRKYEISRSYKSAIGHANNSLILMASYFLPSSILISKIKAAAKRGVTVKLILPKLSDVPSFKHACSFLYDQLLSSGIHIYEYPNAIVHGKVAVIDNYWSTVGSYNINHLGDHANIELNLEIADETFNQSLTKELECIISQSDKVSLVDYKKKNGAFGKLFQFANYLLVRITLKLLSVFSHPN